MLAVDLLSVVSFADIFSQSVGCVFVSLMVSFDVQKLLNLIRFQLLFFFFGFSFSCQRRQISENIAKTKSEREDCLSSSRSVVVFSLRC